MSEPALFLFCLLLAFVLGGVFGAGAVLMLAWREMIYGAPDGDQGP